MPHSKAEQGENTVKEEVSKKQYTEKCYLDTYRVDQNKIGKASGIWQLMQESACHQMENQKPSYSDLLDEGKALMLARVDLAIPEEVFLDERLTASSWPCESTRATFLRNYTLTEGDRILPTRSGVLSIRKAAKSSRSATQIFRITGWENTDF